MLKRILNVNVFIIPVRRV